MDSRTERALARALAVVNDGLAFVVMKAEMASNWLQERLEAAKAKRKADETTQQED